MLREKDSQTPERSVMIDKILRSSDGTSIKLVQTTKKEGFATIESGRYEMDGESICCLSTQIGCAMSCGFCRSTDPFEFYPEKPQRMLRNLISQEIVDQALNAFDAAPQPLESNGIVFSYMGIGEPFANINAIKDSVTQLGTKYPRSRATLSTIAFNTPEIIKLADEVATGAYPIPIKLHISLHSPFDEPRQRLIPHASPISETLDVAEYYAKTTDSSVKLNYVLIAGFNNNKGDASRLVGLLQNRKGLILKISDLNSDSKNLEVSLEDTDRFESWLLESGIETCRFSSKGRDIKAGCGEFVKGKKY